MTDPRAMDQCHADLIYGAAVAFKPSRILELGVGTGLITKRLLEAIQFNEVGRLTCVDNWLDTNGKPPDFFDALPEPFNTQSPRFRLCDERSFCFGCKSNVYDFLVSDADHSGDWPQEHFRICTPGALMFFHDTNTPEYAGLYRLESIVKELGWPCIHFKKSSRPDERCERGLLMVVNGKDQ
jgi:hypothetical protein